MKKYFLFVLFVFLSLFLFYTGTTIVSADTACGTGAYCTGTNNYLKVGSCFWTTYCENRDLTLNAPHTCPTGGGSGSCVATAIGKDGCNTHSQSGSGVCSSDFSACTNCNGGCGSGSPPYPGSCNCGSSTSCGTPDDGPLGCCLAGPYCGDGSCNNGETSGTCPADCSSGGPFCGDGTCNGSENCSSCPSECGACPSLCGNGTIDGGETCDSCPADVGACPGGGAVCGNGIIESGETCENCPADVGACPPPGDPECVPDCSGELCGQANGCGGFCSDRDDRPALQPTQDDPADEAIVVATPNGANMEIELTITTQANVNYNAYYTYIDIYPVGTSCANALADCGALVATNAGYAQQVTYTYVIPLAQYGNYSEFQWRVYHQNNTCTDRIGDYSPWQTFIIGDEISGSVLRDDGIAGLSGGVCTSPFSPVPYTPAGGETITVTYNGTDYTTSLNPDGTWSIQVPISSSGEHTVAFASGNASDSCGCPSGCTYSGIDSPTSGLNIYYQPNDVRDPWWQTVGGNVFAGQETGSSVLSEIPTDTCIGGACEPYLNLKNEADEDESSGGVLTGGGTIDTSNTTGYQTNNLDEDGRNFQAVGTSVDTLMENYAYFDRLYSMGLTPTNDINTPSNKPTSNPVNGRAHYRNGNLTINNAWTLSNSESRVIFVNGDLTVNNSITVPEGGFLAFVVKGNITFGSSVCQSDPDSIVATVQGVFLADGSITVQTTGVGDCKFVAEGIFSAWNGFSLRRDFRDGGAGDFLNAQRPVHLFKYRPDFVVNIPERMTRPLYEWQEVAP
jgi:hypothetical protein